MNDVELDITSDRALPVEKVSELVRRIGQVIANADLYGLDHKITAQTITQAYEAVAPIFETISRLRFAFSEGEMLVNGQNLPLKNPLMLGFAERLRLMQVSGFALTAGMAAEEFDTLVRILSTRGTATDEESFVQQLASQRLTHVETVGKVVLQEVHEDEVVVDRDELSEAEGRGTDGGGDAQVVQQITAFLKGEIPECEALQDVDGVANDPAALADLIMEATAIRQRQQSGEGEDLGEIVVGCLRRAFDQLCSGKAMKTKKGRRQAAKMMAVLEKDLLDRLRSYSEAPEASAQLASASAGLVEELKVDDVVSDYLKRRSALEESEHALQRVGDKVGVERLEALGVPERMSEAGVPATGWRKLVVGAGQTGDTTREPDSLAALLTDLGSLLDALEHSPELGGKVSETLKEMGDAVEASAENAEAKLDDLAAARRDTAGTDRDREEAWRILPEIIQELCQPLSVVNSSLDMVVSRRIGALPNLINETLELALVSGHRMDRLVLRLLDVCGVPDSLSPMNGEMQGG